MKNSGYMKDAFVLFVITLISGFLLGGVYQMTKEPIEKAKLAAGLEAYRTVFQDAADFQVPEGSEASIESCNADLASGQFGNAGVGQVLEALDGSGAVIGHVFTAYSNDSYSGPIQLSVGVGLDGTISGVELLEISDTPGLGLKAAEPEFKGQYAGKNAQALTVVKSGSAGDDEINSISGATITSSAVTNAVNAALHYVHNYINQ